MLLVTLGGDSIFSYKNYLSNVHLKKWKERKSIREITSTEDPEINLVIPNTDVFIHRNTYFKRNLKLYLNFFLKPGSFVYKMMVIMIIFQRLSIISICTFFRLEEHG